jgi:hypothetical protein
MRMSDSMSRSMFLQVSDHYAQLRSNFCCFRRFHRRDTHADGQRGRTLNLPAQRGLDPKS